MIQSFQFKVSAFNYITQKSIQLLLLTLLLVLIKRSVLEVYVCAVQYFFDIRNKTQ
jgi:hypothetical protein